MPPVAAAQSSEGFEGDLLGAQLGNYRLIDRLGHGGMGAVYLGEQVQIGSKVAVKVLHEHLAVHTSLVQRFYAEARAVNLIGHENIVSIFDMSFAPPSRYYYIMEYLEGCSLAQFARAPLGDDLCIPILQQVCDGLQAAHARGVVHRDLKPENIFLTKRGRIERFVKILDFGIAKLFSAEYAPERTRPGVLVGTPEYCPPEQASGDEADPRFDLYALGIIAYRLTTGRLPYTGKTIPQVLIAHRDINPPAPHELATSVSRPFSELILRAIAKRPQDRFQSAAEFKTALHEVSGRPAGMTHFGVVPEAPRSPGHTAPPFAHPSGVAASLSQVSFSGVSIQEEAVQPSKVGATIEPTPSAPSIQARLVLDGTPGERLRCVDVSRGGMFVCADAPFPPLMSRVSLLLEMAEESLPCTAEVVRHVDPAQARTWSMSAGFAVQFVDLRPAAKDALARCLTGRASAPTAIQRPGHEAAVELVLQRFRARQDEVYAYFGLPQDTAFADIRQKGRELKKELEALHQKSLTPAQMTKLDEQSKRLDAMLDRIATPQRRLEYDALIGNFRGVARCIAAGLTVTELEATRAQHLAKNAGAEARGRIHLATARSWESREQLPQALEEYQKALAADPIHLEAQQRYWVVKRRLEAKGT